MNNFVPSLTKVKYSKLNTLINFIESRNDLSKQDLFNFIEKLGLSSNDLLAWANFDHPHEDSYGRKTICLGDQFELMVMSWIPGDFSMIHNHGDASWGIVQVFGELTHRIYSMDETYLKKEKEELLESRRIIPVTHELIHQMGNALNENVLSLHFYFNETSSDFVTDNTYLFDVVNNQILTVRGGAFYGLPKEEIIEIRNGLSSSKELKDQEVQLLQHRLSVIS